MFRSQHAVADVEAFLRERLGDVADVAVLGSGEWSQAFSFRLDDADRVVRFGRFAEDYEKDRVAASFATADLPIPEIHEIGQAFDGVYAISTRAFGEATDTLDEAGYRRLLPSLFCALDALRRADVSHTTGYGIWNAKGSGPHASWRDFLLDVQNDRPDQRTHGWRERMDAEPAAPGAFAEGYRILEQRVDACTERRHLVHADIVGDNVRARDGRVTAFVDWASAMYGDFLYDLARPIFWAPWFPEQEPVDVLALAREHYASIALEVPHLEDRLRCCLVHIGLDAQAYNAFTLRREELLRSGQRTLEVGEI